MLRNWKKQVMKIRINSGENLQIFPSFQFGTNTNRRIIEIESNAQLDLTQVNLVEDSQEYHYQIYLIGEFAICNLYFLDLTRRDGKLKTIIEVFHQAPNCKSRQLHKGIYADNSVGILKSYTEINNNSAGTDSLQLHRSILLSNTARVYIEPHLKIDIDIVKCKHGISVGKLDDQMLFYLQSRGLSKSNAKRLLIDSFEEEILNTIKNFTEQQGIKKKVSLWI